MNAFKIKKPYFFAKRFSKDENNTELLFERLQLPFYFSQRDYCNDQGNKRS